VPRFVPNLAARPSKSLLSKATTPERYNEFARY
jgi:hypothetical protein